MDLAEWPGGKHWGWALQHRWIASVRRKGPSILHPTSWQQGSGQPTSSPSSKCSSTPNFTFCATCGFHRTIGVHNRSWGGKWESGHYRTPKWKFCKSSIWCESVPKDSSTARISSWILSPGSVRANILTPQFLPFATSRHGLVKKTNLLRGFSFFGLAKA